VIRQRAEVFEFLEQQHRQRAGACAELEQVAATERVEDFRALLRETAPEHRRDLGRGDEIAGRAKLHRARAVIAKPGLVERDLHVPREWHPAAACGELRADPRQQSLAVRQFVGAERRERCGAAHRPTPVCATATLTSGIVVAARATAARRGYLSWSGTRVSTDAWHW
jgi:hypothetical protein